MADKNKSSTEKTASITLELPIEWRFPEGQATRYANQVLVQYGANECFISFFEVRPPLLIGSTEKMQEQAKGMKAIPAECVARIAVSRELMPSILKVLQEGVDQLGKEKNQERKGD